MALSGGDALWPSGSVIVVSLVAFLMLASPLVAQWLVLRRHSRRAAFWLGGAFLGWVAGILAAFELQELPRFAGFVERFLAYVAREPVPYHSVAADLLLGLLVGGITGGVLVYILRAGPPKNASSRTADRRLGSEVKASSSDEDAPG